MAQLFGVGVPAISKHLKNIFEEGELTKEGGCVIFRIPLAVNNKDVVTKP